MRYISQSGIRTCLACSTPYSLSVGDGSSGSGDRTDSNSSKKGNSRSFQGNDDVSNARSWRGILSRVISSLGLAPPPGFNANDTNKQGARGLTSFRRDAIRTLYVVFDLNMDQRLTLTLTLPRNP